MPTFELSVPPRPTPDPPFEAAPPAPFGESRDDRRHRELLAAIEQLGTFLAEQEQAEVAPVVVQAQPVDYASVATAIQLALAPLIDGQASVTATALDAVVERLKTLSRQIAFTGSGSSSATSGITNGEMTALLTSLRDGLRGGGGKTLSDIVTVLTSGVSTTLTGTPSVTVADGRTLTERLLARAPASGFTLWLDVTSTDSTHIYIAEAPTGTAGGTASFQGIRITLDASGNPLGAVETATAFAWNSRAAATWAS